MKFDPRIPLAYTQICRGNFPNLIVPSQYVFLPWKASYYFFVYVIFVCLIFCILLQDLHMMLLINPLSFNSSCGVGA